MDEPPIGAVVVEDGRHVWLRRQDGWYGCLTCDAESSPWSWEEVRADIGRAPWRVVLP